MQSSIDQKIRAAIDPLVERINHLEQRTKFLQTELELQKGINIIPKEVKQSEASHMTNKSHFVKSSYPKKQEPKLEENSKSLIKNKRQPMKKVQMNTKVSKITPKKNEVNAKVPFSKQTNPINNTSSIFSIKIDQKKVQKEGEKKSELKAIEEEKIDSQEKKNQTEADLQEKIEFMKKMNQEMMKEMSQSKKTLDIQEPIPLQETKKEISKVNTKSTQQIKGVESMKSPLYKNKNINSTNQFKKTILPKKQTIQIKEVKTQKNLDKSMVMIKEKNSNTINSKTIRAKSSFTEGSKGKMSNITTPQKAKVEKLNKTEIKVNPMETGNVTLNDEVKEQIHIQSKIIVEDNLLEDQSSQLEIV